MKESTVAIHIRLILLIYLKVLVLLEGRVESEHYVEWLHHRIIDARVNGNVQNVTGHSTVVS